MSDFLATATFEVIPLEGAIEAASALPKRSKVSVTASPNKGIEATIDLAIELQRTGYRVTPHLAAKLIQDLAHLDSIIDQLAGEGINTVLVVGGDGEETGKFNDALELLRGMDDLGHHFAEVGVTGYPEGHPYISGDLLREALISKRRFATFITTQMCFDVAAIETWIQGIRSDGVDLPIEVGIPGVVDPIRLARVAGRIGVGTSIRYLLKNRGFVRRLFRPGPYRPTKLVRRLAPKAEELGLRGLHIFTFNQVEATLRWHERMETH